MHRYYYISDSIEDLASVERALQNRNVKDSQIHVYGPDAVDSELQLKHVHSISSLSKSDLVSSSIKGLLVGLLLAGVMLVIAYSSGWYQTEAGWPPVIFLAIVLFGFCGWEGGLQGIQKPNAELSRFKNAISKGKLVFYVDIDDEQQTIVRDVVASHPGLRFAGDGSSSPSWLVHGQTQFQRFVKAMP